MSWWVDLASPVSTTPAIGDGAVYAGTRDGCAGPGPGTRGRTRPGGERDELLATREGRAYVGTADDALGDRDETLYAETPDPTFTTLATLTGTVVQGFQPEDAGGPGSETFRGGRAEGRVVYGSRIVSGLAVVFAGMAALFAVFGVVYNLVFFAVAAVFGAAAYFVWYHASGRFARRVYRGVESQARPTAGEGTGAGPRDGQRAREAAGRTRQRTARDGPRGRGTRADGARAGVPPTEGITDREAYARLGLDPGADADAVKRAYREKVKQVHPDTDGGDEDEFKRVKAAYERLSED